MAEFDISTAIGTLENHEQKLFPRSERLSFFDIAFDSPNWEDAVILDLGGNRGNLREDLEQKKVGKRANYYCLDVDHEALAFGQSNLPECEWVPFNAYNPMYNKTGLLSQKFPFGDNMFDLLCCYSVYSHTTHENFMHDIKEMQRVVKPGGKIAVTFVDEDSVKFFLTKRRQDYPDKFIINHLDVAEALRKRNEYVYFVDHDLLVDELHSAEGINHLVTVYHKEWLVEELNSMGINVEVKYPKQGHIQKTLVFNA